MLETHHMTILKTVRRISKTTTSSWRMTFQKGKNCSTMALWNEAAYSWASMWWCDEDCHGNHTQIVWWGLPWKSYTDRMEFVKVWIKLLALTSQPKISKNSSQYVCWVACWTSQGWHSCLPWSEAAYQLDQLPEDFLLSASSLTLFKLATDGF